MTLPSDKTFDVIILGAGPAGSAAATTVAAAGLTVALIDKAIFPREKLCGGCFTGRSSDLFETIYGSPIPKELIETRQSIVFYAHGQPLGQIEDIPPIHLTMRRTLDAEMHNRAISAGATDFSGCRVTEIEPAAPSVVLHGGQVLRARVLIGADGVNSQVARRLFGESFNRDRTAFGLEVEAPAQADTSQAPLRIDFGAADWGYGWEFPKQGSTTIGICGLLPDNPDMKAALRDYLGLLGQDPDMRCKGHFLPFGDFRSAPGRGAVLLAGDAAGLVDPITGEGIALAMESGHLAGLVAVQAIGENCPERAFGLYRKALKPIHRSLKQARMLRHIIYAPSLRAPFISAFRNSRTMKTQYMRLLAGEVSYGQMMRSTLRRMPGFAFKAMKQDKEITSPKG